MPTPKKQAPQRTIQPLPADRHTRLHRCRMLTNRRCKVQDRRTLSISIQLRAHLATATVLWFPEQPVRRRRIFLPADRHTRLHRCRMLRHQHKAPTLRTPPVLRAPASRRLLAPRLKLTRHQHKLSTRRQSPVRAPTRRRISIWCRSQIWRQAQASQLIKIKQSWL